MLINLITMKKTVLLVLMSFLVFQLSAQKPIIYDSLVHISNGQIIQTPIWFDLNDSTDRAYFMIDTINKIPYIIKAKVVVHQGGKIMTAIEIPSSFQIPSLLEAFTLKVYSPGSRCV